MSKTHRDKTFHLLRNVYNVQMTDLNFQKLAQGLGINSNPQLDNLLKDYRLKNGRGFMSNYRPFAHRHAGDRNANMKGELRIKRAEKRAEKQKINHEIAQELIEW